MKGPSAKRMILFSLLALVLSLLQPLLLPFSMAICVTPVLIALLYAWAGWIPALILSVGTVIVVGGMGGLLGSADMTTPFAAGALLALVLPGLLSIWNLDKRVPFFRRMALAVVAQVVALTALISAVYLGYHMDLVDFITGFLQSGVEVMPLNMQQVYLQYFYMNGMLTEESVQMITRGIITGADLKKALQQGFETMNYQIRYTLPALLLNIGLMTGIFMTTLPSLVCARRGDEPSVDYHPVSEWYLPSRAVVALVVLMGGGFVLMFSQVSGADALTSTVMSVGSTLFMVQGVAMLSRRLKASGVRKGFRIALILLGLIFASGAVSILGVISALFGRKGAISGWMRRRMEEKKKEDDDE